MLGSMPSGPLFQPPVTKPTHSAARIVDDWYVAAAAEDLSKTPMAVTVTGIPIVIFRGSGGRCGALLDRCPHRNVPLSLGRVVGDELECGYHGWRFGRRGRCETIPGLCGKPAGRGRHAVSFPVREESGYIWVYPTPYDEAHTEPERNPFEFPHLNDPGYFVLRQRLNLRGTVHAVAENALDVPHTAFLHRGLFRKDGDRQPIDVEVRRWHDRVEAEYFGESRPSGLIGKVLAPGGGVVEHVDRFLLPSIAQVEYRLGETHLVASTALTPVTDDATQLWGAVAVRIGRLRASLLPTEFIGRVLKPLAIRILMQDARVLESQAETIKHFGGEQYVSTEIDVLGPHILKLLRQAERGRATPVEEPTKKRLQVML